MLTNWPLRTKHARFTLVELLVVIVIILILAGMLMAGSIAVYRGMRVKKTKAQIRAMEVAFEQYQQDWGFYPQMPTTGTISNVFVQGNANDYGIAKSTSPAGAQILYLDITSVGLHFNPDTDQLVDPWNNPYYYQCPGTMNTQTFDLWSMGPDGKMGSSTSSTDTTKAQTSSADTSDDIANWKRME